MRNESSGAQLMKRRLFYAFPMREGFSGCSGFLSFSGSPNEMKTLAFIGIFEKRERP